MISKASEAPKAAYVWVWLPGKTEPVVAGLLKRAGSQLVFNYGRSYLDRPDAISLYVPELSKTEKRTVHALPHFGYRWVLYWMAPNAEQGLAKPRSDERGPWGRRP